MAVGEITREYLEDTATLLEGDWVVKEDYCDNLQMVHPSGAYLRVEPNRYSGRLHASPGWSVYGKPWINIQYDIAGYQMLNRYERGCIDGITVKLDATPQHLAKHVQRRIINAGYLEQWQEYLEKMQGSIAHGLKNLDFCKQAASILGTKMNDDYLEGKVSLQDVTVSTGWLSSRERNVIGSAKVRTLSDSVELELRWVDYDLALAILETVRRHQDRYNRTRQLKV